MSLGEVALRSFTDLDSTPHDGHVAGLRRCQRCPAAGGAFAFAAAPPGVGDCLVSRKCRTSAHAASKSFSSIAFRTPTTHSVANSRCERRRGRLSAGAAVSDDQLLYALTRASSPAPRRHAR